MNKVGPTKETQKSLDVGFRTCFGCGEIRSFRFLKRRKKKGNFYVHADGRRWNGRFCINCARAKENEFRRKKK